ncbi:hypothetical protein HID58_007941 [Brassica napus]|uniref:Alpha/beta hydrolase fold-3 domain-containing protein n=1 Tax=Brassica napus TaxID=3708 RepID=A0ABQ7XHS7_BRANA|nr:hypothetical protein HID58_007941 [Brassica napus]
MSEPSEASDPCALIGIVKNPDGTITREPTRFPCVPAEPDLSLSSHIQRHHRISDFTVDFKLYDDFCNLMARVLNVVVASPSYRLAPEHRLPAAYHDGADALTFIRKSDDEWIKSHVYLFNVFLMGTGSGERCESKIRHENDRVFPPAVGDLCWELCLPVGENRDHAYSNPTMGDGLEVLGALKWKVMVCGGGGDPMIDRQRDVAKLMKEKGIHVVECFTDGDVHGAELGDPSKSQTLFASIKSFISSTPYPTPDPSPVNTVVSKDITVSHSNSTWMRLYVPVTALNDGVSSKKLPLVVYYHGGGFVICSVDFKPFHDFCNRMARELNAVVASPSYRLAPEHRLPAAYDDGVDALRFIRTSDEEWIKSHADLSNVFLMGTSAGDRQRDVAKLMKEKGVHVVERFTDGDVHGAELGDPTKSTTLFASIRNLIYS